jgi:AAA15 family ATPase/GTPase
MIESIKFQNFKALRDTTLPLGRFTLIVGPNGSGKTTALNALSAFNDLNLIADARTAGVSQQAVV